MHISPHVSVHIYAYQQINKKSQVLFHKTCLHLPQKKEKNQRKKLMNLRVSVSSGTLALELIKHVQCQFSLLYLLYGPLQKCVLTLDDVMLQVQRIYVNKGSRGKGQGSDVARHYKVYELAWWKVNMQHVKDCTGKQTQRYQVESGSARFKTRTEPDPLSEQSAMLVVQEKTQFWI